MADGQQGESFEELVNWAENFKEAEENKWVFWGVIAGVVVLILSVWAIVFYISYSAGRKGKKKTTRRRRRSEKQKKEAAAKGEEKEEAAPAEPKKTRRKSRPSRASSSYYSDSY